MIGFDIKIIKIPFNIRILDITNQVKNIINKNYSYKKHNKKENIIII